MITLKELNYVNTWAKKAPYPGELYAEKAAEKLIDSLNIYEKLYKDKEYDFILSNGEQFEFEILSINLCHMLGIDYKSLVSKYHDSFRKDILGINGETNSYEVLNAIIDKIDKVLEYDKEHSGEILNYYKVMIKCSIFEKLSDFSKFNFGVINFDNATYSKMAGRSYNGNSEKFLYVQSNEQVCPYFMVGILPDRTSKKEDYSEKKYAVETLFAPTNPNDFFANQSIAIPTQILTTTSETMEKNEATSAQKLALLNQYRTIIAEHSLPNMMNIYGDYLSTLSTLSNSEKETGPVLVKK